MRTIAECIEQKNKARVLLENNAHIMPDGTVALRICQEGHANALALNKDSTQIAVAGRSRKHFDLLHFRRTQVVFQLIESIQFFSIESAVNRYRWLHRSV